MVQVFSKIAPWDKPHAYRFNETNNMLAFDPVEMSISTDGQTWESYYDNRDLAGVYLYGWEQPNVMPVDEFKKSTPVDGQILMNSSFDSRDLTTQWIIYSADEEDQQLAYQAMQRWLMQRGPLWVCFSNSPGYKYLVRPKPFTPTYNSERDMIVTIVFNNFTGMRESVVNSTVLKQFGEGVWQYGMNLPNADDAAYTFSSNQFRVWNPSDVSIEPLLQRHQLTITVKGSGTPTITNETTGDEFAYSRDISGGTLELRGVDPYFNGINDGINSDHGVITLAKGWNEISVTGATVSECSFDFPFVYH
ncbi:phage tail domain-containing protein [Schleiferilactobacillus shenzhenensis]|uniref:Siphovirus-type tail component RIFT-related domain-containing protein n=1 Tax=Schleiferilactobacillus shenzhenensis LY-73 TaxID=1231336 RepID=U4TPE4_9LACO|nr:phage tail domain-containing protein [Schleiferilactobacillus shenzhenensis]ERL63768.1 hypothetical protein L248_2185 [Schleiferilactobacillus shenzhenensis LY-73]